MKRFNKKAFTLIELLAVIIILGVLMIIAIPAVTMYISNARKSAYVDTAKTVIQSARVLVNSGKLDMYDTSATYYIPTSCIMVENGKEAESPYGRFKRAYVVVTFEENKYNYYWVSVDETGQGIKNLTNVEDLDSDQITAGLKGTDISIENVPGKTNVVEFSSDCTSTVNHEQTTATTTDHITWIYKDLSLKVDVHLPLCNIDGNYKICYNATIDADNIGNEITIKSFVATFDVPEGTVLVNQGYTQDKLKVELNGTKLTVIGNGGQNTWSYLRPENGYNHMDDGFQIKFPKDADFVLKNGNIQYVELVSGTQEGTSSGVQGDASDMSIDLARLHIRLVRDTYYNDGNGGYVQQYTVYVKNISDSDITDWSFILEAPSDNNITNIFAYNPLIYSKNGNVYTFTPFEWDNDYRTLSPKETATYEKKLVIETKDTNTIPIIR